MNNPNENSRVTNNRRLGAALSMAAGLCSSNRARRCQSCSAALPLRRGRPPRLCLACSSEEQRRGEDASLFRLYFGSVRFFLWMNCSSCGERTLAASASQKFCSACAKSAYRQCRDRWGRDRPLATKAASLVNRAIQDGEIPPARGQKCVDCGGSADRYDHRDYTKPLWVEPVCHGCNRRRGPGHPYRNEVLP